MRARIPERHMGSPCHTTDFPDDSAPDSRLLQPLLDFAKTSDNIITDSVGTVSYGRQEFSIPRFIFLGPKGGGDTIRLGLFATFHGNEPEGAEALIEFFKDLEQTPEAAKGFHIYAYPICNPSGFAAGKRASLLDIDLVTQFWRLSSQAEAYYLEREMGVHAFQGVVSFHTAKNAVRFAASCRSSVLEIALVQPALQAARAFMPGLISESSGQADFIPSAFLTLTDELRPAPFEINLGIPGLLPGPSRIHGTVAALKSLLNSYRGLKAFGQNL